MKEQNNVLKKVDAPQSVKVMGAPLSSQKVEAPQSLNIYPSSYEWNYLRDDFENKRFTIVEAIDTGKMIDTLVNYHGKAVIKRMEELKDMEANGWYFFKVLRGITTIMSEFIAIKWTEKSRIAKPKKGELFRITAPLDIYDKDFCACVFSGFGGYAVEKVNPNITESLFSFRKIELKKKKKEARFVMERDAIDWDTWSTIEYAEREHFTDSKSWELLKDLVYRWQIVRGYPVELLTWEDLEECEKMAKEVKKLRKEGDAYANA